MTPPRRTAAASSVGAGPEPPARPPRWSPTALTMRPTFGSSPNTAVLTSGELTTALPIAAACSAVPGARTATRITCSTPSPLRTTSAARSRQTPAIARPSASSATGAARCEASASTMSLVL